MFKFLTDLAHTGLDVLENMATGERLPDKEELSKLIAGGMTIAAAAIAFDATEDMIRDVLDV